MKYDIPNNKLEMFDEYAQEIEDTLSHIVTNIRKRWNLC